MKFQLTEKEFAVLEVIRSQETTSIDRLRTMFYGDTDKLVQSLESYGLIRAVYPQHIYYTATPSGKSYLHKTNPLPNNTNKKTRKNNLINRFRKLKTIYRVFAAICAFFVGLSTVVGTVFAVLQFFKP